MARKNLDLWLVLLITVTAAYCVALYFLTKRVHPVIGLVGSIGLLWVARRRRRGAHGFDESKDEIFDAVLYIGALAILILSALGTLRWIVRIVRAIWRTQS
jgi:hypothetical protein